MNVKKLFLFFVCASMLGNLSLAAAFTGEPQGEEPLILEPMEETTVLETNEESLSEPPSEPSETISTPEAISVPEANMEEKAVDSYIDEMESQDITSPHNTVPELENPIEADKTGLVVFPETYLIDFVVPETIQNHTVRCIGSNAFRGCESFRTVTIPVTVMEIGEYAFADCPNLTCIILSERSSTDGMFLGENWSGNAAIVFGEEIPEEDPTDTEAENEEPESIDIEDTNELDISESTVSIVEDTSEIENGDAKINTDDAKAESVFENESAGDEELKSDSEDTLSEDTNPDLDSGEEPLDSEELKLDPGDSSAVNDPITESDVPTSEESLPSCVELCPEEVSEPNSEVPQPKESEEDLYPEASNSESQETVE